MPSMGKDSLEKAKSTAKEGLRNTSKVRRITKMMGDEQAGRETVARVRGLQPAPDAGQLRKPGRKSKRMKY